MRKKRNDRYLQHSAAAVTAAAVIAAGTAVCQRRGMFFAGEMYPFLTVWFLLCAVIAGIWLTDAATNGSLSRGLLRPSGFSIKKSEALLLLCPFIILILYMLTWLRNPVSSQGTLNEVLRWGFYASFALLVRLCAGSLPGRRMLAIIWSLIGGYIALSALLAVFGVTRLPYAIAYSQSPEVSVTGARLGGLLEYPNTFGAVMAVFWLERLFAVAAFECTGERRRAAGTEKQETRGSSEQGERRLAVTRQVKRSVAERVMLSVAPDIRRWTKSRVAGQVMRSTVADERIRRDMPSAAGDERRMHRDTEQKEWGSPVRVETRAAGDERRMHRDTEQEEWGSSVRVETRAGDEPRMHRDTEQEEWGSSVRVETRAAGSAASLRLLRLLLPLFPYAAALLLSESRGAWLAAACASAAALLWKRQLIAPLLAAGAAPVAAAAVLYRQLARTGLAAEPMPGLLVLAGLWAGALLAGLWLYRRWQVAAGRARAAWLVLAAAGWTAAGTAVLMQVSERITGPSTTVAARGLFYRDAWKLAGEHLWLGRGGETWRNMYLAAQSRPYVGSQVHSGYLDILLNLGLIGLATVLLLLLASLRMTASVAPGMLAPLLVILLHGAVDFDWSYGLIWLLLFMLPLRVRAEVKDVAAALHPPALLFRWGSRGGRMTALSILSILCFLGLALGLFSFRAAQGVHYYRQSAGFTDPGAKAVMLKQSLEWNPLDPRVSAALSVLLPDKPGMSQLQASLKYSPENAVLQWELAKRAIAGQDPGKALFWVRRSMRSDVFHAAKRTEAVTGMLNMGKRRLADGDKRGALKCASAGLEMLRQYRLLAEAEDRRGRSHNDRRFAMIDTAEDLDLRLRVLLADVYGIKPEINRLASLRTDDR